MGLLATAPTDTEITETLLRAAAYDKNLDARTPEGFRLGVAFDVDVAETKAAAETFARSVDSVTSSELTPSWIELVGVESTGQLYKWIREHHVTALFVPAGLEARVPSIVAAAEAAGVFTLAGSPLDVERGLVLGLRVSGDSKKLVVNMAAAERAGVDFEGSVRQVASRVGDAPDKIDRDGFHETLVQYSDAIRERDLDALRTVWPGLEGEDEQRIVASFKMARSHSVYFAMLQIDARGETARARVRRTDKLITRDGQAVTAGTLVEIAFSKAGDRWQIDSMNKASPPS